MRSKKKKNAKKNTSNFPKNSDQPHRMPFRFFKIILPSILDLKILRIPETFTKKYGNRISGGATLTVPTGVAWKVVVTEKENTLYFEEGWAQFMDDNLIEYGYFLEFEYFGKTQFTVHIFDLSCCEIDYPRSNGREEDDGGKQPSLLHEVKKEVEEEVEAAHTSGVNASFSIVVHHCHFNYLQIPRSFEKYVRGKATEYVKLQVEDGKEWLVEGYTSDWTVLRLTGPEWRKFTMDNNWCLDEEYRFQIIETHQDPNSLLFKVLKAEL